MTAIEIAAKLSTDEFANVESPLVLAIVDATLAEDQGDLVTLAEDQGDLLEKAWVIIANAADWMLEGKPHAEWIGAAEHWRDSYFATLPEPAAIELSAFGEPPTANPPT